MDLILRRDEPYERTRCARRQGVDLEGLQTEVLSPEDLVLSMLQWASGTGAAPQREDVRVLLRGVAALDAPYLEERARTLASRRLCGKRARRE